MNRLGSALWHQSLVPYTAKARGHSIQFGLDTEFYEDSNKQKQLLCWQLSLSKARTKIFTEPLNWESLYANSLEMAKEAKLPVKDVSMFAFIVFNGAAEAQWLDWKNSRIQLFGGSNMSLKKQITKKRCLFLYDLAAYFKPSPLRVVANVFGLHKHKYDVRNLSPDNLNDKKFLKYAANDAYITLQIFKLLREKELTDSGIDILLTHTPGATAAAEFRSKYIDRNYGQRNTNLRRMALLADWGSVQECFYRGYTKKVYEYDATNMFAQTTCNMDLLPLEHDWQCTVDLDVFLAAKGGLCNVIFKFPNGTKYPCLPVETKKAIIFPAKGRSFCTQAEVKQAIAQGAEITLARGYYYNTGVPWFGEYLKTLMKQKAQASNKVDKTIAKLKIVAVIGKLSQKLFNYDLNEVKKLADEKDLSTEQVLNTIWDEPITQRLKKVSVGSMFYPEWHALILGAYRATIWKTIIETNALVCLTDAVFTEQDRGDSFVVNGISFLKKSSGDYLAYKAGYFRLGKKCRVEKLDKEAVEPLKRKVLMVKNSVVYITNRILTARQSFRGKGELGANYQLRKKVSLEYDFTHRYLLPDGNTMPLRGASP